MKPLYSLTICYLMTTACVTSGSVNETSYHYQGPLNVTAKQIDKKFDSDFAACQRAVLTRKKIKDPDAYLAKNAPKIDRCMRKKNWKVEYAGLQ